MIDLEHINNNIELLNSVFDFRDKYEMQDDCILDVLEEYAHQNDLNTELLARELSDLDGFLELVEVDLKKHGFSRTINVNEEIDDGWE